MPRQPAKRVLVIGLDCATPRFLFGPDRFMLPNLQRLADAGGWGVLRSCDPPITVPAWACMTSGKDPGVLGCYGFRNRIDYSYDGMATANASSIREKRVWDILSRHGRKVIVLGVPQTYPVTPVNGWLVADFLAPDTRADYTYPKALKTELEQALGTYLLDVKDFRTEEKDGLLERIFALMHNRFDAAEYLMRSKPWDFFMMVEMGVDRLHHAFWKYCDPLHPKYEAGNRYQDVFREYYEALDARIGKLLMLAGDETAVMVVSDHGAKAMRGGLCINQWLFNQGWLHFTTPPNGRMRIEDCTIDWARTRAWASGGYYGRVFLNVEGREPQGVIPAAEYDVCLEELRAAIEAIPAPDGVPLGNRAWPPGEMYRTVNGVAPDLIVYFGGLDWRSVGTMGFDGIYTFENDTGPDDANHDFDGVFIMDDRSARAHREWVGLHIMDVAPTILDLSGVPVPEEMQGKVIE